MTHDQFISTVWKFYLTNRRALPWRPIRRGASHQWGKKNSYKIVVSEIILQQTQVERVISLYKNFLIGMRLRTHHSKMFCVHGKDSDTIVARDIFMRVHKKLSRARVFLNHTRVS